MRIRRTWTLVSAIALAALCAAATQDEVTFRRDLKPDTKDSYDVTMKGSQVMEIPGMGEQDMKIDGGYKFALKIMKVDDKGVAETEIVTSDMQLKMSGSLAEMMQSAGPEMPKEVVSTAKLDSRYRLTEMKMKGANMQMMIALGSSSGMSPFIELPEKGVKVGDTWDISIPANPMLGDTKNTMLKGTYKGEGKLGEVSGRLIEMSGSIPFTMDVGKLMEEMAKANPGADPSGGAAGGMKITISGTMVVNSSGILDPTTNKFTYLKSNIKMKTKTDLVDMGMSFDGSGSIDMAMKAN